MNLCNNAGMDTIVLLQKNVGETPLECLERFRASKIVEGHTEFVGLSMTYAGRLDPVASGSMLVLLGEECKNKEKYLNLEKEYDVEILFGIETDTQDVLGLITRVNVDVVSAKNIMDIDLQKYVGKFTQKYPAYSSKTVDGKQLHTHAREGTLPRDDEMPSRDVEIYSINEMNRRTLTGAEIAADAIERIEKVTGDFRQKEIIKSWKKFGFNEKNSYTANYFQLLKIRVTCSSGTYMRLLAQCIGEDAGTGAIAFSICRTKIGNF